MSGPEREAIELFLQEASEHLQYLREYVSVLQEIEPRREDLERLYIAAHTLNGTSASYGFPHFSEIAGKLSHVFQYSLNATLGEDLHGPLTEFLSDGISLLETDLLEISDTGNENVEDITGVQRALSLCVSSRTRSSEFWRFELRRRPSVSRNASGRRHRLLFRRASIR